MRTSQPSSPYSWVGGRQQVLSQEPLYRLGKVAATLECDKEEVIQEDREYLEGLPDAMSQEQCNKAAEAAVKKMVDGASAVAKETQSTRGQQSIIFNETRSSWPSGLKL